ncbi:MAG TPA: L,D-transpeptidase [Xanthobacteraceae bacterium]|nr:L,D-transpeptidase [Xanthobacteraceae bacterium]
MRRVVIAAAWAAICALLVTGSRPAAADILVNVSKSSQRMSVLVDGTVRHNWLVSTGSNRYTTPSGVYKPQWLARKWRSKQYANAPMPHSIFFHKGYAIHGTTEVSRLGKIASHGCVRLHPDHAAKLYSLVQSQMANTRVVVSDDAIEPPGDAPKKKPGLFMAETATGKEPAINAKTALDAMAMAPKAAAPKNPQRAQRTDTRETPRPKPVREKIARAPSRGFHW